MYRQDFCEQLLPQTSSRDTSRKRRSRIYPKQGTLGHATALLSQDLEASGLMPRIQSARATTASMPTKPRGEVVWCERSPLPQTERSWRGSARNPRGAACTPGFMQTRAVESAVLPKLVVHKIFAQLGLSNQIPRSASLKTLSAYFR